MPKQIEQRTRWFVIPYYFRNDIVISATRRPSWSSLELARYQQEKLGRGYKIVRVDTTFVIEEEH